MLFSKKFLQLKDQSEIFKGAWIAAKKACIQIRTNPKLPILFVLEICANELYWIAQAMVPLTLGRGTYPHEAALRTKVTQK